MPREGFVSITVSQEVEKKLRERYEKSKQYLLDKYSITNFSGFLLRLSQLAEEQANQHNQQQTSREP